MLTEDDRRNYWLTVWTQKKPDLHSVQFSTAEDPSVWMAHINRIEADEDIAMLLSHPSVLSIRVLYNVDGILHEEIVK